MNMNKFMDQLIAAFGGAVPAKNWTDFAKKLVAAVTAFKATADAGVFTDAKAQNAIKVKTQIAALTGASTAAQIVTALQA